MNRAQTLLVADRWLSYHFSMMESSSTPRTTIARFTYAAEAGYFAEALDDAAGIDASVFLEDQFDPISATWLLSYLLQVPVADGDRAIAELERLIAESDLEEEEPPPRPMTRMRNIAHPQSRRPRLGKEAAMGAFAEPRMGDETQDLFAADDAARFRMPWGAMLLLVTAVAGGYAVGSHDRGERRVPPVRRRPVMAVDRRHDLVERIAQHGASWTQHDPGTGTSRELRFDARRGVAIVREDSDNDGTIDRVWEYEIDRRP